MAVGSGVIPRKATLEAPVLPANRPSRRQPPGRTRDSIPLSENHTPIPSPDSGAGPACERRRPEPRSCGPLLRRRTRSLRCSDRPLLRYAGLPRDSGRRWRSRLANAIVRAGDSARLHPWHSSRGRPRRRTPALPAKEQRTHAGRDGGIRSRQWGRTRSSSGRRARRRAYADAACPRADRRLLFVRSGHQISAGTCSRSPSQSRRPLSLVFRVGRVRDGEIKKRLPAASPRKDSMSARRLGWSWNRKAWPASG